MESSGICSTPLGSNDVLLLYKTGAGYQEVMLLGPIENSAKQYASILENWVKVEYVGQEGVVWSQEDDYAAAAVHLSSSRFLASSAESQVKFGSLVSYIKANGFKVSSGLVVPKYCTASHLIFPKGADRRLSILFNVSDASENDQVLVSCQLSIWHRVGFWLFVLGVPSVLVVSFVYAFRLAKNDSIPLDERRLR